MSQKEYLKGVSIRDLTCEDADKCKGLGFDFMLEQGYKVLEVGDLYCIVSKSDYEAFGKERICDVVYLVHDDFFEEDLLRVDFAHIANAPDFNKPLEIEVSFVKELYGSNEALYKSVNGKHYIRQDNTREQCAVWLSAFKHKGEWTDNAPIRPNVTFVMGNERETVSYSNWAGPGVWGADYNEAFSLQRLSQAKNTLDVQIEVAQQEMNEMAMRAARRLERDARADMADLGSQIQFSDETNGKKTEGGKCCEDVSLERE